MKREKDQNVSTQMERIQEDAQMIASEAHSLAVMANPAAGSRGNLRKRLRHLQARVDRLRRTLWRVQASGEPQVVPFRSGTQGPAAEPSLVDRVLALLDRRCG